MTEEAPSLLKRALLALEKAEARASELERAQTAPIAVIGAGCRVPGADDPGAFWQLLVEGRDEVTPTPRERWDPDAYYDPNPDTPGKIAARAAGFLRGPVDRFDAAFFGIAPREAQGMDPQQRLLLEVSWEALEHAGQSPKRLERSQTGVYFGVTSSDYWNMELGTRDASLLDAHFTSGIAHSVVSGRVSYLLGLQGPSLTIDTACSSSLVAVHLACQALRSGDCQLALAGGVNLMLAPELYIALSRARMLSPDGRCKTFDAAADGFGRGEGCGVVVLKPLAAAVADGDRILAVIRGSAVNQDGPSGSLTAPNGPAQEAVVRKALSRAGIAPSQVGYIEAHGTGTELGDPLEVQALGAVFGEGRAEESPLLLASVKTNIGHLEGAAGVVGLIKLALCAYHRQIPAHLHFQNPSPHIPWAELPFRVPTALTPWPQIAGKRVGGVSSFGFSGTNAHVVVEEPPARSAAAASEPKPQLLAISARDRGALRELAARYAARIAAAPELELADLCLSANTGRAHFEHRASAVARSTAELGERLRAFADGTDAPRVNVGESAVREPPRVAFLFTGQGAQYAGMARGLYQAAPAFRAALDQCAALLAPHLERPLLEVLFAEAGSPAALLDETAYTQPALFAVEYALAALWRSIGVEPEIVIGHSVGEYTAACVAGVLDLESAARLIAVRGRLMQSLPSGGAMAAIFAAEAQVAAALAPHAAVVSLAGLNGPEQTVISGRAAEVAAVCAELGKQGIRSQPLPVSHAFHSPLVEPILEAFSREAASVRFSAPRIKLISNVTGGLVGPGSPVDAAYLRRHLREPVRFEAGLRTLLAERPGAVIEIGPHPTLLSFAKAVFGAASPPAIASLRKNTEDYEQWLDAVGRAYLAGAELDFRALAGGRERRVVELPSYPFQRERYWFQAKPAASAKPRGTPGGHPLLGTKLRLATGEPIHELEIGASEPAFVRDHGVLGQVVVPATLYLEALLALAERRFGSEQAFVSDVSIEEALLLDRDGATRTLQLVSGPSRDGAVPVTLSSAAADEPFRRHVTALLRPAAPAVAAGPSLAEARSACTRSCSVDDHYAGFEARGLDFGEGFRVVRELFSGENQALGRIELGAALAAEAPSYRMHPVLLDGCLQVLAAALSGDTAQALYLPIAFGAYALHGAPHTRCWSHVRVSEERAETRRADVLVFDDHGELLAEVREVTLKRVARDALSRITERWLDDCLYEVVWRETAEPAASEQASSLPEPGALLAAARAVLPALEKSSGLEAYDVFLPRFEQLCVSYTLAALRELGWSPKPGERVSAPALAEHLGVLGKHGKLFARLLAILSEAGFLERDGRDFKVVHALPAADPAGELSRLRGVCPDAEPELEFTARTASELAGAMRGDKDPIQLLFPGGSLTTAERLYRDTPTAKFYNGLMAELLTAVAAANAEGRPLRILEIGAGTGGTTSHVAPRLPSTGVEYTFTDVGPLFVARARERFAAIPFLRYGVLDLERDPASQGFAEGSFDVVVASNVIHATAELRSTLAKVRRLLRPGGMLAMLEVTAPQRWFDLTVGLTEGWWAFSDSDLRPDYPTLSRSGWQQLLKESGFDRIVALPEAAQGGVLELESVFLARSSAARTASDFLIFADRGGSLAELVQQLRARGDRCTVVRAGSEFSYSGDDAVIASDADIARLVEHARTAGRSPGGAVFGFSLDLERGSSTAQDSTRNAATATALLQALTVAAPATRVWLLTRGAVQTGAAEPALEPFQAPIHGLGRAARREHAELRIACIDVDFAAVNAARLLAELDAQYLEPELSLRGSGRFVPRLIPNRPARARSADAADSAGPYRLKPSSPGSLEAFSRVPLSRRSPGPGEVEIEVAATGLNFKDVLNALGMYPGDPGPLGGECAGTVLGVGAGVTHVQPGDPVFAVAGGSFSSHVVARAELVQSRPNGIGPEEGAVFPIAFLTAEFCLSHLAKLRAGERVLIHAAAGGVGLAAVQIAQRAGAEVFATAGSEWKRELLRSLGVTRVYDSRSPAFAHEIERATDGRGVDVILNSLAGELLEASFRVLARKGRFVEIGKRGIKEPAWVAGLGRDIDYHIVDWGETAEREPQLIGALFAKLVGELRDGKLRSLPRHVFSLDDASRAFRFMAQAGHVGRIVLSHRTAKPSSVRRDGTYLVTGGLSGIGPVVASWLVERGAGRVVLIGRRAITPAVQATLEPLRRGATEVLAESVDVTDEAALRELFTRLRKDGPPLRGVFHGAGVLDDAGLLQQDALRFARVFGPKVEGGALLDRLVRPEPLDFFVAFSSVAAVLGSPGQANHSAANAYLDLLARERTLQGLPSLSINWGAWTEVGAAADRGVAQRLAAQGIGTLTPEQGLRALERLLGEPAPQVAVLPIDWRKFFEHAHGGTPPPLFSELGSRELAGSPSVEKERVTAPVLGLREQLAGLPESRIRPAVAAFVRERALRALGLDPARDVDPTTPLRDLGLDSLLSVELRNTLGSALGRTMPATLLFDYPTLETLTDHIVTEALGVSAAAAAPAPAPRTNLVDSIEELSDEDVERELAALARKA